MIDVAVRSGGILLVGTLLLVSYSAAPSDTSSAPTIAPRLVDAVSILEFTGADPTGVGDSTEAFQSAIQAAIARNRRLWLPGGTYRITKPISVALRGSSQGMIIEGDGNTNPANGGHGGTILDFSGMTSTQAVAITSDGLPAHLSWKGITFKGGKGLGSGMKLQWTQNVRFQECTFVGFGSPGARAVQIGTLGDTSAGHWSGGVKFNECVFEANAIGVWTPDDQANFVSYVQTQFLDHSEAAIKIGTAGRISQARAQHVHLCDFEGNRQDVLSFSSLHGFTFDDNYVEERSAVARTPAAPNVELRQVPGNAGSSGVSIRGNVFQRTLRVDGEAVISLEGVHDAVVKENWSAVASPSNRRFFCVSTSAQNVQIDPPASAAPQYVSVSRAGPDNAQVFTSPASDTDFVSVPWYTAGDDNGGWSYLSFSAGSDSYPPRHRTNHRNVRYTRHGSAVTVQFDLELLGKSGGGGGAVLDRMPFVNLGSDAVVQIASASGILADGPLIGILPSGSRTVALRELVSGKPVPFASVAEGARLKGSVTYQTR